MHTLTRPSRIQRFITRHARILAVALWLAVSAILVPVWLLILRHVFHIASVNTGIASSAILVSLIGTVTLALYWEHVG